MLSNKQKALVKQAQRDAGLSEAEYREIWATVTGRAGTPLPADRRAAECAPYPIASSRDPRLTDEHFDNFMKFVEAIFWRNSAHLRGSKVFSVRGYWARKNTKAENSRDRFTGHALKREIADLEWQLARMGLDENYTDAIRVKVIGRNSNEFCTGRELSLYAAALRRTVAAKQKTSMLLQ